MLSKYSIQAFAVAFCLSAVQAAFAQPVTPAEGQSAVELYRQHKYAQAVISLEKIIKRRPTATYCYYAALANRSDHKELRAKQLFQFIITNYPNSQEASYAKQIVGDTAAAGAGASADAATAGENELPESVKALLPPDMQKMLTTPAGMQAVKDVMKQNQSQIATIRKAEQAGVMKSDKLAAAAANAGLRAPAAARSEKAASVQPFKERPFSPEDIAKSGAAAIDQMRYPNCWFEASMAALAELPRGQRLISSMIRGKAPETYVVRFPGDGVEYVITTKDLDDAGIHDSALWASLIECAQIRKFPDNEGANGAEGDQSRLEIGLRAITGCKADVIDTVGSCTEQQLSSFIGSAVKSQNPIVAATYPVFPGLPQIAVTRHAYTIIGFDPSRNMIVLRNPHGKNGTKFQLASDPNHLDFEQLEDGVFKMSIRCFQKYFYTVCRSFI